jgi:hyperosmotically inducible periplasmic protein
VKSRYVMNMVGATLVALSIGVAHAQTDAAASSASAPVSAKAARKQVRAENRALAKSVRQALAHTKGLSSSGINVIAKSGAVTLVGTVPDQSQIGLAEATAKNVSGVMSLKNNLTLDIVGN